MSLGVYGGVLKTVCVQSKSGWNQVLAAASAGLLWRRSREVFLRANVDCVLPVPCHWTRRIGRAERTPATLARVLSRRLQVDTSPHILVKVRRTPAQSRLTAHKRRANLRGAFQVRGAKFLSGRSVLLVDDILTTGTTANEASKVLRRAGVKRVIVAVLARGLGHASGA